jgi:hypothetical protein
MDPLSIATGCASLIGTITKASISINGFVRDMRSARTELDGISRELLSLKTVLELLEQDATDSTAASFPETLRKQITGIITNCSGVIRDIEDVLEKHQESRVDKAAKWALSGKSDANKLKSSLEAHKSALEIALDMLALYVFFDEKENDRRSNVHSHKVHDKKHQGRYRGNSKRH